MEIERDWSKWREGGMRGMSDGIWGNTVKIQQNLRSGMET